MAWFSPTSSHRSSSPKRYLPKHARTSWRVPRRPRLLSWSLCIILLIAIVFWPQKRSTRPSPTRQKRPDASVLHQARAFADVPVPPKKRKQQRTPAQPAEHVYRTDGLLDVNPKGKHPILELIDRSETQWKRKLERQSKTLKQAVDEYRRRYKRSPPKGFEIWWDFVDFHKVKLVDEYDSIHERLQPFWGVDPSVLRASQAAWESYSNTFTIGKVSAASAVELLNYTFEDTSVLARERIQNQLDILEDVQDWLPEFRATFTTDDGPTQMVSWELRSKAEEAAARGEYIDVQRVAASVTAKGWAAACPPNTPIHSYEPPPLPTAAVPDLTLPVFPQKSLKSPRSKSLIYNHRLSMSPCLHPSHIHLNGFLSQFHYPHQFGPSPHSFLAPTFSICVSPLHQDILTAAPEQYTDDVGEDPAWGDKADARLLWRGSSTGILHQTGNEWNSSQRIRLVEMSTRRGGEMQVLLPRGPGGSAGDGSGWDGAVGFGDPVRASTLNAAFMDVSFVGKPIQCIEPVCTELKRMFQWHPYQSWQDAWMYKYIMDIDGNGWSARFKRLMTSNSLVFKSTIFPEWYTERIMPWVHYIPVDLSDIYDILAFFRGDLAGAGAHDDLAERIATAGKAWSREFYRKEDMSAYHFRLFLEYARVMSLDREAMTYRDGDEDNVEAEL
ncbi:glycosyl transferase family 90-domain-containing protein [Gautieria morchelliformis]|nr:glycosyl transferase family 90-domain-containing protein [Gautieria morchelliformis]